MALAIRKQSGPRLAAVSMLFYGLPKCGKTRTAAQFPVPLILNCEPGGTDGLPGQHDIIDVTSLDQLAGLAPDIAAASHYQTVVIDGLTFAVNEAVRKLNASVAEKDRRRNYANAADLAMRAITPILRSGKLVIATGHSRSGTDPDNAQKVLVRPDVNPRLVEQIMGLFGVILYVYGYNGSTMALSREADSPKRNIRAADRFGLTPERPFIFDAKALAGYLSPTPDKQANGQPPAEEQPETPPAEPAKQAAMA